MLYLYHIGRSSEKERNALPDSAMGNSLNRWQYQYVATIWHPDASLATVKTTLLDWSVIDWREYFTSYEDAQAAIADVAKAHNWQIEPWADHGGLIG